MYMFFDCFKALRADYMLDLACVLGCDNRVYTELYKAGGQKLMALIYHLCNGASLVRQIDKSGIGYGNLVLEAQIFHGDAYAGLFKAELIGYVDGADNRKLLAEN